jgi:hypothetical protein
MCIRSAGRERATYSIHITLISWLVVNCEPILPGPCTHLLLPSDIQHIYYDCILIQYGVGKVNLLAGPALDRCGRCPRTGPLASSGPPVYITLNTYIKPGLAHEATSSQPSGLCGSGVIRPRGPESCALIGAFSVLESIPR